MRQESHALPFVVQLATLPIACTKATYHRDRLEAVWVSRSMRDRREDAQRKISIPAGVGSPAHHRSWEHLGPFGAAMSSAFEFRDQIGAALRVQLGEGEHVASGASGHSPERRTLCCIAPGVRFLSHPGRMLSIAEANMGIDYTSTATTLLQHGLRLGEPTSTGGT